MGLSNASLRREQYFTPQISGGLWHDSRHVWSKGHHLHSMEVDAECETESLGSREGLGSSSHPKHHPVGWLLLHRSAQHIRLQCQVAASVERKQQCTKGHQYLNQRVGNGILKEDGLREGKVRRNKTLQQCPSRLQASLTWPYTDRPIPQLFHLVFSHH